MAGAGSQKSMLRPLLFLAFGILSGTIFANLWVKYAKKFCVGSDMKEWEQSLADLVDDNNGSEESQTERPPVPHIPDGKLDPLYDKVRVLCFVMTLNKDLNLRTTHVKQTWCNRCNIRLFMGDTEDKIFPIIGLPNRTDACKATKGAFQYIWDHYRDEADWFLRTGDQAYVVLENLRSFLKDKNPDDKVIYGRKVKGDGQTVYDIDEQAGYVISRAALKAFTEASYNCPAEREKKTFSIRDCLEKAGVHAGDARDSKSRELFHSRFITFYTSPPGFGHEDVLKKDFNPTCVGINCTTTQPITFNGVGSREMFVLEYAFYKARVNARCLGGYRT